jgi:AcrR family transcriptional regulator
MPKRGQHPIRVGAATATTLASVSTQDEPLAAAEPGAEARRRSDWLATRERILAAARDCFAERGYQATTTKELAAAADIAEVSLFRHFPTKAAIFEAAAVEPINDFLRSWIAAWTETPVGVRDPEAEGVRFYATLIELLSRERRLLAVFLATISDVTIESSLSTESRAVMGELLDRLEVVFRREGRRRGFRTNPHITPRLVIAMALGTVVHGDWLFGFGRTPKQSQLVKEMSNFTNWGLPGGPPQA